MFSLFSSINFRNLLTKSKRKKCKFSRLFSCLTAKIAKKKIQLGFRFQFKESLTTKTAKKMAQFVSNFEFDLIKLGSDLNFVWCSSFSSPTSSSPDFSEHCKFSKIFWLLKQCPQNFLQTLITSATQTITINRTACLSIYFDKSKSSSQYKSLIKTILPSSFSTFNSTNNDHKVDKK